LILKKTQTLVLPELRLLLNSNPKYNLSSITVKPSPARDANIPDVLELENPELLSHQRTLLSLIYFDDILLGLN
jgi:hypothetical protein